MSVFALTHRSIICGSRKFSLLRYYYSVFLYSLIIDQREKIMFMEKSFTRRHTVIAVASIGALRLLVKLYRWHSEQARINEFLANHPEPWKGNG